MHDDPAGDVTLFDVLFEQHCVEMQITRLTAVARLLDEADAETASGSFAEAGGSIAMAIELAPDFEGLESLISMIQEYTT